MNWDATKEEMETISAIVSRAASFYPKTDKVSLSMDITAAHCNGSPLDLDKLLAADNFNFLHDVSGIARHINRETGELENCFVPRCAI
jgi:hypothetical protein